MIVRPTQREHISALQLVAEETGLFPPEMLPDMLEAYLGDGADNDIWLTCVVEGVPVGLCYAAPEKLTDGTWNMLALAVRPSSQGRGMGRALVKHLEAALCDRGQRILIVDTSGTDAFAQTREFYRRNGYVEEARIRDFWGDGDDKIVFWKSLG